jgi:plastocyanin
MGLKAKTLFVLIMAAATLARAGAETITGTISITRRLTKRSVTPSIPVYQRGPSVRLGTDANQDPLAFERSRVVIYIEGPGPAGEVATAQIAQSDRRFVPDLVVVPVDSVVSFPNMDPIFHNVFSLSKAKSFDLGSYDQGQTRKLQFPNSGIVEIYCRLHPNMAATIVVTPNRWYARVDPSGQYRIPDVPPGKYTLVAWHKAAGFIRKSIVVEAGKDVSADFLMPITDGPK